MKLKVNSGVDSDILLFCAFRYALGRRTYVVGTIASIIAANWKNLSVDQRQSYQKEIREAIAHNRAGMDMDVMEWEKLLDLKSGE
jgi:hypothetical protein